MTPGVVDLFIPFNAVAAFAAAGALARYIPRGVISPPTKFVLALMVVSGLIVGMAYAAAFLGLSTLEAWRPFTRPATGLLYAALAIAAYLGGDYRNERR